jgi:hypothetical protein
VICQWVVQHKELRDTQRLDPSAVQPTIQYSTVIVGGDPKPRR